MINQDGREEMISTRGADPDPGILADPNQNIEKLGSEYFNSRGLGLVKHPYLKSPNLIEVTSKK